MVGFGEFGGVRIYLCAIGGFAGRVLSLGHTVHHFVTGSTQCFVEGLAVLMFFLQGQYARCPFETWP